MYRNNRQIATLVAAIFLALVAACPLAACSFLNTTDDKTADHSGHACCPKTEESAHHQTKSSSECPLLMSEGKAGFVQSKFAPQIPIVTAESFAFTPELAQLDGESVHSFPDRDTGDLNIKFRVLRI